MDDTTAKDFLNDKIDFVPVAGEKCRFVLSLVPYEQTTTYFKGTSLAPEAIVAASMHMELLDEALGVDPSKHGILTLRPTITDLKSITSHAARMKAEHEGALLGFIGGEHSITPAIIEGLEEESLGIVWIDAHADLREIYRGRRDNHACAGFNSIPFGNIVQIGVRTLAREEVDFLKRSDRVAAFMSWCEPAREMIRHLPRRVYVSIDLDGLSPTLVRAVGTPEPGGLSWKEILDLLDFVFSEKQVCAFDTVELCPKPDDHVSTFTAAKLVYKVMAYHTLYRLEKGEPRPLL